MCSVNECFHLNVLWQKGQSNSPVCPWACCFKCWRVVKAFWQTSHLWSRVTACTRGRGYTFISHKSLHSSIPFYQNSFMITLRITVSLNVLVDWQKCKIGHNYNDRHNTTFMATYHDLPTRLCCLKLFLDVKTLTQTSHVRLLSSTFFSLSYCNFPGVVPTILCVNLCVYKVRLVV